MKKMAVLMLLFVTLLRPSSATAQTQLLRGPYLQVATDTSIHIRWRTDVAEDSKVQWGTSAGNLTSFKEGAALVNDHEVVLTGLLPNTKYWYSIGSTITVLQRNSENYFQTLPSVGSKNLLRIGVLGDCGSNNTNQIAVRDQLQAYLGSAYMNAWLLLGDNAYSYGLDAEYQAAFFNMYGSKFLKQSPLFPTPGNHDYSDNATLQSNHQMPYYDVFSMPTAGEGGGVPSNNKAYYSFNIGNVHILSLDSYGKEDSATRLYDTLGRQVQWIKQDLEANKNKGWVIAYWHHPPFSLGSRNSETEGELIAIRTNFIRILERYGVDLILCGHSHNYERSKLQKGFYGFEAEFNAALHNLSTSSALYDGSANACPYTKDSATGNAGTVYVVSGSAGQLGMASAGYPHDAMYYSNTSIGGSMMLEIEDNRLDAKWISADGVIRDKFTMMKEVSRIKTITINPGDSALLTASFIGSYNWSNGSTTRSIKVAPAVNTTYYAYDAFSCIRDTFNVRINNVVLPANFISVKGSYNKGDAAILVNWKMAEERGVAYYMVERSIDGQRFTDAGKVLATGNASSDYLFKDAGIDRNRPVYYYRIRQVDNNGAVKYSPVVAVNLLSDKSFDVQLIPNPAHRGEVKIRLLNTTTDVPATITITDASGKTIATKNLTLRSSLQSFMPEVQAGAYFVTVKAEGFVNVLRLIVE